MTCGMKNWKTKAIYLYTAQRPHHPLLKPCSRTKSYWPSHCAEKWTQRSYKKNFFNCLLGNQLGTLYKKLFSLHSGITKTLKIKGLQSPLQPPYRLPITDALTANMVIILALACCRICHAPNDVTWVSYCAPHHLTLHHHHRHCPCILWIFDSSSQ